MSVTPLSISTIPLSIFRKGTILFFSHRYFAVPMPLTSRSMVCSNRIAPRMRSPVYLELVMIRVRISCTFWYISSSPLSAYSEGGMPYSCKVLGVLPPLWSSADMNPSALCIFFICSLCTFGLIFGVFLEFVFVSFVVPPRWKTDAILSRMPAITPPALNLSPSCLSRLGGCPTPSQTGYPRSCFLNEVASAYAAVRGLLLNTGSRFVSCNTEKGAASQDSAIRAATFHADLLLYEKVTGILLK